MEEIVGHVERITFQNSDNGFTIAHLSIRNQKDLACIVGSLPSIQMGETLRCKGTWQSHLMVENMGKS